MSFLWLASGRRDSFCTMCYLTELHMNDHPVSSAAQLLSAGSSSLVERSASGRHLLLLVPPNPWRAWRSSGFALLVLSFVFPLLIQGHRTVVWVNLQLREAEFLTGRVPRGRRVGLISINSDGIFLCANRARNGSWPSTFAFCRSFFWLSLLLTRLDR